MRLQGGRTAKRAVVAQKLELTGLMKPFSTEIWFGDRVGVLGSNGSGKSHFLRLLAAGGTDPDKEHLPVSDVDIAAVPHEGSVKLGARIRPGFFAQTHSRPDLLGRTLVDILHRGDEHRSGLGREAASAVLDRYGLAAQAEQPYDSLSGGQQARLQILLLELSGATHAAAARRADGQPRPPFGGGPRTGHRRVRGDRDGRDARPLVRPQLRPVPRLRFRRQGVRDQGSRLGREQGRPSALNPPLLHSYSTGLSTGGGERRTALPCAVLRRRWVPSSVGWTTA
ncbi:hypothetical protein MN0502_33250 [Arthrobacter sp. MN05-02]|nr:hypothetical protein MN0502_33250 [Arthrobacter sp. MN05-02]